MSLKASHTKVRQLVCFQAPLGLQSIMALCLLLFLLMNVKGDKLNAFDCDEPTNVEYVSHHKCHIPTDSLTKREMVVLQEKRIQTIDGYECSIYSCPHLSHFAEHFLTPKKQANPPTTYHKLFPKKNADKWLRMEYMNLN